MIFLVDKSLSCCVGGIHSASNEGKDEFDWLVDDDDDFRLFLIVLKYLSGKL